MLQTMPAQQPIPQERNRFSPAGSRSTKQGQQPEAVVVLEKRSFFTAKAPSEDPEGTGDPGTGAAAGAKAPHSAAAARSI